MSRACKILAFIIGVVPLFAQEPPAGKFLYCQPPPAVIEFGKDEISLVRVSFPTGSPSAGIEVKKGLIVPHGNAEQLKKNKGEADVFRRVKIKRGSLWYEGRKINFNGLRVYKIRVAYRWGEWVICDGYTSASDDLLKVPASKREGMLPSEIVYFKPGAGFGRTKTFGFAPLSIEIIGE